MIVSKSKVQPLSLTPDLTPLLDILFIVMVFLLLSAAVKLEALPVDLPAAQASSSKAVTQTSLTVNLQAKPPYWALNRHSYADWETFTAALLTQYHADKRPIIIGADQAANVQNLVKLLEFLQANGIAATELLTQPSNE